MATYPARPIKREPCHPGLVAADVIDGRVSAREAAKAIGLSPTILGKIFAGDARVTAETALRFGQYFGNGARIWLDMQSDYDLWHAEKDLAAAVKKIKPLQVV